MHAVRPSVCPSLSYLISPSVVSHDCAHDGICPSPTPPPALKVSLSACHCIEIEFWDGARDRWRHEWCLGKRLNVGVVLGLSLNVRKNCFLLLVHIVGKSKLSRIVLYDYDAH